MENTTDKPKEKWNKPRVGSLWKKEFAKSGRKFLSGVVRIENDLGEKEEHQIMVMSNIFKKDSANKNEPDFHIYLDDFKPDKKPKNEEPEEKTDLD